jgi:DNA-binding NarL/FixJ family response regulator
MKTDNTVNKHIRVKVVGENVMQNELTVSFLAGKTEYECSHIPSLTLPITDDTNGDGTTFYLLDAKGTDVPRVWNNLDNRLDPKYAQLVLSVYNLDPEDSIGIEAIHHGIRGIFFNNQPIDVIPKGIQAILEGEMWYPRKILSKCIRESKRHKPVPDEVMVNLTRREKEILLKIFSGESNQEIADTLCISYHTVKTHAYNIYRKIKTPDRFQATLWAAKHL